MKNYYEFFSLINKKKFYKSFLFTSFIFFWNIRYEFIELRFAIVLLIFPILIKLNKEILLNISKHAVLVTILFFYAYYQSPSLDIKFYITFSFLFFLLTIFDYYQKFFFQNLEVIINLFIFIFLFFILFNFIVNNGIQNLKLHNCINCFNLKSSIFRENSHLGIIAPTVIYYLIFLSQINKKIRYPVIFIFCFVCFFEASTTFLAGIIMMLIMISFLRFKNKFNKYFLFIFLILTITIISQPKYSSKITEYFFTENNKGEINLSSEVIKASHFVARKAIFEKPFGYGMNNYEHAFDKYIQTFNAFHYETLELNRKDASNNFSKIITEFGIFSVFYFYLIVAIIFKKSIDPKLKILFLLPLLTQTFIRGVGYFNGGFLLFLFYSYILYKKNK